MITESVLVVTEDVKAAPYSSALYQGCLFIINLWITWAVLSDGGISTWTMDAPPVDDFCVNIETRQRPS
jgi:hypothetical protein